MNLIFNGNQLDSSGEVLFPLFTVWELGHPRHGSTLTPRTLRAIGATDYDMEEAVRRGVNTKPEGV